MARTPDKGQVAFFLMARTPDKGTHGYSKEVDSGV